MVIRPLRVTPRLFLAKRVTVPTLFSVLMCDGIFSNSMTSVRLPTAGKIKYNVPLSAHGGGGSRPLRLYDFRLASASALEHTDMNSLWLCVGRDPAQRFGGAWLLTAAYDVEAWLPASTQTVFNQHEGKTYLRLWFIADKESVMPYEKFKMYVVRVALVSKPDEVFLTVGGAQNPYQAAAAKFMNPPVRREQWKLYYPPASALPCGNQQQQTRPYSQRNPPPQTRPSAGSSAGGGVIFNPWGEQQPLSVPPPPNYPPPPSQAVPGGFSVGGLASYGIEKPMEDEYVPQ